MRMRMMLKEAKCSLYGCQQVVNRKLSAPLYLNVFKEAKVKSQFENSRQLNRRKFKLTLMLGIAQMLSLASFFVSKNCWPHRLFLPPPDGLISGAWYNYSSSWYATYCIMNKEVMTLQLPILKMSCLGMFKKAFSIGIHSCGCKKWWSFACKHGSVYIVKIFTFCFKFRSVVLPGWAILMANGNWCKVTWQRSSQNCFRIV